ncbi:hypothetical protein [Defluviimonas salinarum]|uniref:Uncharacterized protein n=1 Tax=Defluviimonas salinarum TaxID=2992147 RepID=A0ABT3J5E2_9RHOB|nr:hypothetical protein [Defluviimonas salinarum]MCW3782894.1 hypothetical protein [Defluviimonas salinarum]
MLREVTRDLFRRYGGVIAATDRTGDPFAADPRLSLDNLAWLCRQGEVEALALPLDKLSRWLGFVQGCLAMRRLIDVDGEREATRPAFHRAYAAQGLERPATIARRIACPAAGPAPAALPRLD